MRPVHSIRVLVFAAVAVFLAGCKSECRSLSEKLCRCAESSLAEQQCLQRAGNEEARLQPTEAEEDRCAALYDGCDCRNIGSLEGRQACGLAIVPDAGL